MSTVQVTGILKDPMDNISAGTTVRMTSVSGGDETAVGLTGIVVTGDDGSYNFNVVYGTHLIEIMHSTHYIESGEVAVDDSTPSILTLPALIKLAN